MGRRRRRPATCLEIFKPKLKAKKAIVKRLWKKRWWRKSQSLSQSRLWLTLADTFPVAEEFTLKRARVGEPEKVRRPDGVRDLIKSAGAAPASERLPGEPVRGRQDGPTVVERALEKRGAKLVTLRRRRWAVLGNGKSVLVGMPGAFTPSHRQAPPALAAGDKFAALGVNVAVVTTNDRFVNTGWAESVEACAKVNASGVVMLSDVKGELIEQLGLSAEMGDGLGTRSKRFALIVNDGLIEYVAVDDGLESLRSTSAEALLRNLDPEYGQKGALPRRRGRRRSPRRGTRRCPVAWRREHPLCRPARAILRLTRGLHHHLGARIGGGDIHRRRDG